MTIADKKEAVLILADGKIFKGKSFGPSLTKTGEICFNTGMTGYQEIFTDPSYYNQIVVCTNVHIGNYGKLDSEAESKGIKISGLVCKNFSRFSSRQRSEGNIRNWFIEENTPVVSDLDTREIVRYIRDKGAMNAIISTDGTSIDELKNTLKTTPSMEGLELSSFATTPHAYTQGNDLSNIRIALLDLGVKQNIIRSLVNLGCFVKVFPAKTSFSEMCAFNPSGFMISNGPGDPSAMSYAVNTVKEILDEKIPLFGICLGHQILAKALGVSTFKMFNGHRGINHPIKNLITGKSEITSQNHGFAISKDDVSKISEIEITHIHLNDGTIAGIRLKSQEAFSVQYHPEASPGPHDSSYLFKQFIESTKKVTNPFNNLKN
jgi:carbamoyl-phosphate synthase small subunit